MALGTAAVALSAGPRAVEAAPATAVYPNLVVPALARDAGLGPTNPSAPMSIGVVIAHPDPAGEDRYLHDEYTPGTAVYHHALTPAQFQARFGVDGATLNNAVAWLHAGGLTTTTINGVTDYVLARGSTAQVGQLLHTSFRDHRVADRVVYANTTAPTAPAALRIFAILGLNNLEGPQLNHGGAVVTAPVKPSGPRPALVDPSSNLGLSTPQDLWDVYEQPADNRGSGQTMAIFGWGVTDGVEKDLRFEEHEFGLPAVPISIRHYGTEPVTDTGGAGEWRLDTQSSSGMAPDMAGLKLYFGDAGTDPDLVAAFKAWNADPNGPLQGSASFGGCEETPFTDQFGGGPGNPGGLIAIANANQDAYQAALKQTVIEGRTLFNSAGDTGSSCPVVSVDVNGVANELVPLVQYPCASAYVVCVGGTVLYYDGGSNGDSGQPPSAPATRAQETPWTFTGGGTSLFLAAPDWQSGIPQLTGQCASDPHGNPYAPPVLCRGIPDVAAQSGDGITGPGLGGLNPVQGPNGFAITVNGATDQDGGGTSLSAPLWAGMWTRVQAASATGTGFADPLIYAIGNDSTKYANDFYDISPTNNGGAGGNGLYTSLPGWDYVSGWGTPRLTNLMKDVDNGNTAPVHPKATAPIAGLPLTFSPCDPLFTGTAGNDNYLGIVGTPFQGQYPQLNILAGSIAASPDGKTITTTMVINDLSTTLPPGGQGNLYYFLWGYNGKQYFTSVSVDPTGAITYGDGTVSGNQFSNGSGTGDTGTFTAGKNGTVTVTVPVANIGSPPRGAVLTAPNGATKELVGAAGTGLLTAVDGAGPNYDYRVGQVCSSGSGVTPASTSDGSGGGSGAPGGGSGPIGLPNTSTGSPGGAAAGVVLIAAGMLALRRRRRTR